MKRSPGMMTRTPGAAWREPLEVPDFTLTDMQGQTHRLSDYRGQVVLINFWSVWCAPCRQEMPAMQRAWEKVQDQETLILAVNLQDRAEQAASIFRGAASGVSGTVGRRWRCYWPCAN